MLTDQGFPKKLNHSYDNHHLIKETFTSFNIMTYNVLLPEMPINS